MPFKNNKIYLSLIAIFMIITFSCKKSEEVTNNVQGVTSSKVNLTVLFSEGITGSPAPGTYEFNSGDTVKYNFSNIPGYRSVSTILNGTKVANSGSFLITENSTLYASTGYIDIRGKWSGDFIWYEWDARLYPKDVVFFLVNFTGDILAGKAEGMFGYKDGMWGRGPFNIEGDTITLKIEYWDDSWLLCKGTIKSETEIEGSWYFWSPWGYFPEGTFRLNYKGKSGSSYDQYRKNLPHRKNNPFNRR